MYLAVPPIYNSQNIFSSNIEIYINSIKIFALTFKQLRKLKKI